MDDIVPADKPTGASNVQVVEIHDVPKDNSTSTQHTTEEWQPGFWQQFPWLGLGCLVNVIVLTVAAILVLVFSNGKATSQWNKNIAPNVILSVLNSLASVCVTVAVAQGVAICWWRKAMRGASISDLHNTWSFGSSLGSIFLNLRYFNLTALAALVTKLTIVDGILFQRATTTYLALGPQRSQDITTFPTASLPITGRLNSYGNDTDVLSYAFSYDLVTFINSASGSIYSTYGYGDCNGICALNVSAPGYIATCTTTNTTVDIIADAEARAVKNTTQVPHITDIFDVNFNINFATPEKNYTWIGLNTTYYQGVDRDTTNSTSRCPAILSRTQCELRQAIITYPVYLQNTTVSTKSKTDKSSSVQVYLGPFNNTDATYLGAPDFDYQTGQLDGFDFQNWVLNGKKGPPLGNTTNGGIYLTMQNQYKSRAYVTTHSNDTEWDVSTEAQFANVVSDSDIGANNYTCPWTFDDPMYNIMLGLNTLTFITSDDLYNRKNYIDANMTDAQADAYWTNSIKYVSAIQYKSEVHYETKFGWMFGALASTLVCIALILPVYWEFWELGRKVSFNPVEIANAFQSPVLQDLQVRSGHADDVVKVAGMKRVAYNVHDEQGRRYRIVHHDS